MRRSISYCEPTYALAGKVNNWKFVFTTANAIPKGALLKFDPNSEGRAIDWEVPQTNLKKSVNVIYAMLENGKPLSLKEVEVENRFTPQYEMVLPEDLAVGESITFVMGAPKGVEPNESNGNRAQSMTQRRRNFYLYIDPKGKGNYDEPEIFSLDVRGNVLKNIRVLVPSFVSKNKRFDIVVRFEDEYGNLTSNAPSDTLVELSYENLRENLNWKLFVPETGFITLPNLYFNEAGIYTIQLKNTYTGETFQGPPIKCFADSDEHLLWGLLHGESERVDSAENIESCLRHLRDEKAYQFFATSPFENPEETTTELWKLNVQNVTEFDEADRFTTLLGFQWVGEPGEEGIRQIIYSKDNKQLIRKKDPKGTTLKKLYKNFAPKEIISIPTFTMGDGHEFNFEEFNPEYERVVEIYNAWGSSECTEKDGNTLPIKTYGKTGIKENSEGSIIKALLKNCRFGLVAGGLDDRGIYADLYESDQEQYSPGFTGIIVTEHNRNAIMDALYKRACYATTGPRIILNFSIAGTKMGEEVFASDKPGLMVNRHITGYAAGTNNLEKIEIMRNGKVIKTFEPKGYFLDFVFDDMEELPKVCIEDKETKSLFVFYYVRLTQADGHMAWTSPIWIDYDPIALQEKKAKRALRPVKKVVDTFKDIDFNIDEDEEEEEDLHDDIDDEEDDENDFGN